MLIQFLDDVHKGCIVDVLETLNVYIFDLKMETELPKRRTNNFYAKPSLRSRIHSSNEVP